MVVSPKEKTRLIKKEVVDEINELAWLRPFESRWRIFLIQDADRMNPRAQNHLLKTLEEPPGRSLFILVSKYPRMLLPTIRSRCQLVRFRALRRETVAELLEQMRDLPKDVALSIAGISEGRMSRALDLVDSEKRNVALTLAQRLASGEDPVLLAEEFSQFLEGQRKQIEASVKAEANNEDTEELSREDLEQAREERLAQLNALVHRDIVEYLYLLATWYRDQWVFAETGDRERVWNVDALDRLEKRPAGRMDEKLRAIEKSRYYLDQFIPEERVFRDLFLTLAQR
jgi:DNA polymerase III delta prime subunit